jgi:uncharacterized protein (TIGR01777 family)
MSEAPPTPQETSQTAPERIMVVAGASGVVGRHLVAAAQAAGWTLRALSLSGRAQPGVSVTRWTPGAAAQGDGLEQVSQALEGAEVLVNLAGASLAEGRLGKAHKDKVLFSRLDATRALAAAHAAADAPPPTWLQASAIGYYGDTGEQEVDETAPRGALFLSDVCHRWEEAARRAAGRTRQVMMRIGLVLAEDAPAFKQGMLTPVMFGLGGPLGSGRQWWAWIDADDLARAILFCAETPTAEGVYNFTAPHPERQRELIKEVATCAGRPALLPAPAFALRIALGGVADELLLPSCKALPRRLQEAGFAWERPTLGRCLLDLFDRLEAQHA